MRNETKRLALYLAGSVLLLCLILLGMRFGIGAVVVGCTIALLCFALVAVVHSKVRTEDPSQSAQPYVCPYRVEFDELELRVHFEGEIHERLPWSELMAVEIRIDEAFLPAPWWILFGNSKSVCMYPSEASGSKDVLTHMQTALPNFDNRAVVEAMGLMAGGRVVWSKIDSAPDNTLMDSSAREEDR